MVTASVAFRTIPCILASVALVHASVSVRGVSPEKLHLYSPLQDDTWRCLDSSKVISYQSVNDDYCDCPDGSDEPGTSACPNSYFYCENKGSIPAYIKSWAVNDGVCDEACCDGSDEATGRLIQCPNRCKEAFAIYQKEQAKLHQLTTAGLEAKEKLVNDAQNLVTEWQNQKAKYEEELVIQRAELLRRQSALDQLERESLSDKDTQTPIKATRRLPPSNEGVNALKKHIELLGEEIEVLVSILHDLKRDHNQNYHDMAVKTALSGYDEFLVGYEELKFETRNVVNEYNVEDEDGPGIEEDDIGEDALANEKTETTGKMTSLFQTYRASLESVIPPVLKDKLSWLLTKKEGVSGHASELDAARSAYNALDSEIQDMERRLNQINEDLEKDYGPQREWLQLKNTCVEKNEGEYTYSLCVHGDAHQKSNKDGTRTYLGQFEDFVGTGDHRYHIHAHTHGTRCWNGPERSVRAVFECGADTEILEVAEPEKCEYHFRMRSPAVCSSLKREQSDASHHHRDIVHEEL